MVPWLRAHTALAEYPSLVPSTHAMLGLLTSSGSCTCTLAYLCICMHTHLEGQSWSGPCVLSEALMGWGTQYSKTIKRHWKVAYMGQGVRNTTVGLADN